MVSLAALVLTITMVVVQLAMGQFSPRIVQRILQDKPSQLAIGLFVATFVHAILAAARGDEQRRQHRQRARHRGRDGLRPRPRQHRGARHLRPPHRPVAARLVPHRARRQGHAEAASIASIRTRGPVLEREPGAPRGRVRPTLGCRHRDRLRRARRGGAARLRATRARARRSASSCRRAHRSSACTGRRTASTRTVCTTSLILTLEPTLDEDVAYGVRLLVDIAERSLSDSPFQDPTTAVQALDRLHDVLRQLARRPFPDGRHRDASGRGEAHRALDELGGVRSPRLRRDPDGRRGLAAGLATAEGSARRPPVDRTAGPRRRARRAARAPRRRDGASDGRRARRRAARCTPDREGIGAAMAADER